MLSLNREDWWFSKELYTTEWLSIQYIEWGNSEIKKLSNLPWKKVEPRYKTVWSKFKFKSEHLRILSECIRTWFPLIGIHDWSKDQLRSDQSIGNQIYIFSNLLLFHNSRIEELSPAQIKDRHHIFLFLQVKESFLTTLAQTTLDLTTPLGDVKQPLDSFARIRLGWNKQITDSETGKARWLARGNPE